jgi:hypothetical protein
MGWSETAPNLLGTIHRIRALQSVGRVPAAVPSSSAGVSAECQRTLKSESDQHSKNALQRDWVSMARQENARHWREHRRPISAETLRKRLRIGSARARMLVDVIRQGDRLGIESTA